MDKSKIPAFLLDRKKLMILCIVAICTIVYTFNSNKVSVRVINVVGEKAFGVEDMADRMKFTYIIKNGLPLITISEITSGHHGHSHGNSLSGTYKNLYADEVLSFKDNGRFVYGSGPNKEEGTFWIEDDMITLQLDDWEQSFTIVDKSNDSLVLFDGGNYYYYSK